MIFKPAILFIAFVGLSFTMANAQDSSVKKATVPLFTLNDQNDNEVSLESLRGKVVMLNFWATWCPPCVKELPTMQALKESFADQPFEILAVNMGEDKTTINKFIERLNINFSFPLLVDINSSVADTYRVKGLPATMLIDKQGRFAFGGIGERDWNSDAAKGEISPLFAP